MDETAKRKGSYIFKEIYRKVKIESMQSDKKLVNNLDSRFLFWCNLSYFGVIFFHFMGISVGHIKRHVYPSPPKKNKKKKPHKQPLPKEKKKKKNQPPNTPTT